jgi:branched-chain amino acid transport system substrate-binding protein
MKRRTGIAVGLALAATAATLATTIGGRASVASAAAIPCDGLPMGFMAPITGFVSFIGTEQLHWAQYSLDKFNKENETSFTLSQFDTHDLEPALAQLGATKLSGDKTLFGVVGPAGSQEVRAAGPVFKKSGMPFLSGSATNADLTSGKFPTFFRVVGSDDQQATVDARYMARKLKAKNVFIVDDQTVYSTGIANKAGNVLRSAKVEVQRESVSQKVTDFSSLVSKISDDTDVVFLPWQVAANAQLFYQQMVEQGKNVPIFGSDGLDSGDFKAPGRYISAFARDIRGLPGTAGVIKEYEDRYGKNWGTFGPPVFVSVQALLTAMKKSCANKKSSRTEVLNNLRKVRLPSTILGLPVQFDGKGQNKFAKFYIYKITGNKRTLVG